MSWPTTLISLKKTETFTRDTVPPSFANSLSCPAGVWAMVRVLEGGLDLCVGEDAERLTRQNPGFVEPDQIVQLRGLSDDVRFFVELFREPSVPVSDFEF